MDQVPSWLQWAIGLSASAIALGTAWQKALLPMARFAVTASKLAPLLEQLTERRKVNGYPPRTIFEQVEQLRIDLTGMTHQVTELAETVGELSETVDEINAGSADLARYIGQVQGALGLKGIVPDHIPRLEE